jgi:hypothetical protein
MDLPKLSSKVQTPAGQCREANISCPIHFASVTQSESEVTRTTDDTPVFLLGDQIHAEFVPGGSIPSLAHMTTKDNTNPAECELV